MAERVGLTRAVPALALRAPSRRAPASCAAARAPCWFEPLLHPRTLQVSFRQVSVHRQRLWRRGWDSNPRDLLQPTRFRVERLRPAQPPLHAERKGTGADSVDQILQRESAARRLIRRAPACSVAECRNTRRAGRAAAVRRLTAGMTNAPAVFGESNPGGTFSGGSDNAC